MTDHRYDPLPDILNATTYPAPWAALERSAVAADAIPYFDGATPSLIVMACIPESGTYLIADSSENSEYPLYIFRKELGRFNGPICAYENLGQFLSEYQK